MKLWPRPLACHRKNDAQGETKIIEIQPSPPNIL
jgi:hypothetical protein